MNRRGQQGDSPEKSAYETSPQKRYARSHNSKARLEASEDWLAAPGVKEDDQPSIDRASFAYQLLLLQQRLVAYEQLHLEEIAELRQQIEQLRRTFLQETHPQIRAIAPLRDQE
jgi:hypothetical protein